jgi:vacuolar-type H+-ATPase subunit C/Vma6
VNLWLTNDEYYYEELKAIIKNFDSDKQAEELEQYVHWIIDVDEASMTTDLLSTSLVRVDWHEIARSNQE